MWNRLQASIVMLIAFVAVVDGGFLAFAESDGGSQGPDHVAIEFGDMPDDFAAMGLWAVDLFDRADLRLPPLLFEYHGDDTAACGGWRGAHRRVDGRSVIHICTSRPGNVTAALVLHEMAHAWASVDLPDDRKAEFQALRGWTEWRNHAELAWHENGSEQAAEIIVWGLIDRPVGILTINDTGCEALDAGYRALTGQPPLHGYRDLC